MTTSAAAVRHQYSAEAHRAFDQLDRRVDGVFEQMKAWRGWQLFVHPETHHDQMLGMIREILKSVTWYQPHTTEAGFHMIGRLAKNEVKLVQALCSHKAEEAEHGLWALEDHGILAERAAKTKQEPSSPAAFAVAAVWWRMAQVEDPFGYLGAEYLFEKLTALVTQAALPVIEERDLPRGGLRFVIEHAREDAKHAKFLEHLILDVVTRYPESVVAMNRCFDYFNAVYPLPVWDEAYERAIRA
jgi:Iron-containing redox enzyme